MKSLQNILYRNMLVSSLVPILIIELALLLMYFGINQYTSSQFQKIMFNEVLGNLGQASRTEAQIINNQLKDVSRLSVLVQQDHERFFKSLHLCFRKAALPVYRRHENGAFYKVVNDGEASLYYAATTVMNDWALRKAVCSDVLDPFLKDVVERNPIVTQAYINTWDNMNRLYPFMTDAPGQYGRSINMKDYSFYFLADQEHNPERQPVWTRAYLDPAGQGWMVSNIVPIYNGDVLEAVSGLDVTLEVFIKEVLNLDLPWQASAFMLDSSGTVLAMQEQAGRLLMLKELTTHDYKTNILTTVEKPEQFNLLKNENAELSSLFKTLLKTGQHTAIAQFDGREFYISINTIEQTGWKLVTLVDKAELLVPLESLKVLGKAIGWAAVVGMVVFYIAFFMYLRKKSMGEARRIAVPIEALSVMTKDLNMPSNAVETEATGIMELDQLVTNFQNMGEQLERKTDALIEAKVQQRVFEREKDLLKRMATTDQLTGLANRRKMDEIFDREVCRAHRYGKAFGIIILDVDHFKQVNDTYGHGVGDVVLQEIAQVLIDTIRSTDLAVRWGGEEFMIFSVEQTCDGLCTLAETVRVAVETQNYTKVGKTTVSLGSALYDFAEDNKQRFVARADAALYKAKRDGRNRSVFFGTSDVPTE